jgi:hypothetical protein
MLHRDISSENLMWDPDGDCGILNDFDLAKLVKEMECGPGAKHKTGTLPFLALDLLRSWNSKHLFRHDLESFLCVIMWIVARYENGEEKFSEELYLWLCKNPRVVRLHKRSVFTDREEFDKIRWKESQTYPTIFNTWIYPLRRALLKFINKEIDADVEESSLSEQHVKDLEDQFMKIIQG